MTEDTRRALEIIKPMAAEFNIKVDADDKFLYIDSPYIEKTRIGIVFNSTYATLKEFIGVLMYSYDHDREMNFTRDQRETIEHYWYADHAESEGAEKAYAKNIS